jgi:hypothetical protein
MSCPDLTVVDGNSPLQDSGKKRKFDTCEGKDHTATDLLDPESEVLSLSTSPGQTPLNSEAEASTTKLSAFIALDWHNYVESSHEQFCEQCQQWFSG